MNKGLFILCCSLASIANATGPIKAKTLDFAAPIVQDHTALPGDTKFGTIIYDNNSGGFLGLDNLGNWQTLTNVGGPGANTSLSNLASTAINADLLPATDNVIIDNNINIDV